LTVANAVARWGTINAGDTVAFCRSGAWDSEIGAIVNGNCNNHSSDATYCDFRDYIPSWGSSASARPRFNVGSGDGVTIWDNTKPMSGIHIWNLDIRHTVRGANGNSSLRMFDYKSYIDVCNIYSEGADMDVTTNSTVDFLTIRNSTFTKTEKQAIYSEVKNVTIDSNLFYNVGDQNYWFAGGPHHIYQACNDQADPCPNVVIKNNEFKDDPDGTWGVPGGGLCGGRMLILRGWLPGVTVENNKFTGYGNYGCGAISTSGSAAYTEIRGAVIRRNRITWSMGVTDTHIQADACVNCIVSDNIIESASNVSGAGIQSPNTTHAIFPNFAPTTGTIIRNNTIRLAGGGIAIQAGPLSTDPGATEGQDFVVENNATWTTSGNSCFSVNRPTATGHPFTETDYPSVATNTAGNYCVNNGAAALVIWNYPTAGNYLPLSPGPLIRNANQTFYSRLAVGTVTWSAMDTGVARTPLAPPVEIEAMQH